MNLKKVKRMLQRGLLQGMCLVLALCFPFSTVLAASGPEPAQRPEETAAAEERTAAGSISINEPNFPDPAFRSYVAAAFDTNGSNVLSLEERDAVTEIRCAHMNIRSLQGIHFFPKLTMLFCDRNLLAEIDLSHNPEITYLSCMQNPVTELNITGCRKMQTLDISYTSINAVNLQQMPELAELTIGNQPLTQLDLSGNPNLHHLIVTDADIRSLDIAANSNLETLIVADTWLASLNIGSKPNLPYLIAGNNYLVTLDLRQAPACAWIQAGGNYLVSIHGCASVQYEAADTSDQGTYEAAVSASDGTFDFAAVDPDFARGTVTNLSKGSLSGSVLSGVQPGDTVTYTYTDGGLSVDASVHFNEGNYWIVQPMIRGWEMGQVPNAPVAEARYGTPIFTYGRENGPFTATPPTEPGSWIMHAEVPGTAGYGSLESDVPFEITETEMVPVVTPRFAAYRTPLGKISLPDGFAWAKSSSTLVGDVGIRTFDAIYEAPGSVQTQTVPVMVIVYPKNGLDCTISPITNAEQSQNVIITDGTYRLEQGTDYEVSFREEGTTVVVTITFRGNYYGSAERSFIMVGENYWTVPLSLKSWPEGTLPNTPVAQARYGTPVFSYQVNGAWQSTPPNKAGLYVVRAVVAATDYYAQISSEASFRVLSGPPQVNALSAVYGDILASVDLPSGYVWDDPLQSVGDAGTKSFGAMYTAQSDAEAGGPVQLSVVVQPKNGALCTISPITNEYESRNIVIRDGNTVLVRGKDYYVSSSVAGNVVTVTIEFAGNYTGTVIRTFAFQGANSWLVPLSIENWIEGDAPNAPVADARYGLPVFTYLVDGSWQTEPPQTSGSYTVRAEVAATEYYAALSAEVSFRIYEAMDVPQGLSSVYGSVLSSVRLPEGYTWQTPDISVGDAGLRTHDAVWTPGDGQSPVHVGLQVEVAPKNGALCTISPVTNSYEAEHIIIRDGIETLVPGQDYAVSTSVYKNTVTVQILFIGNYTGSAERSFTFSFENFWVEPLSINDWFEGQTPDQPIAAARYGTTVFSYAPASSPQAVSGAAPETAGKYIVFAEVAGTAYYNGLSARSDFEVLAKPVFAPEVPAIHTTYGTLLSSLSLPAGFTWAQGSPQYVGDVGEHIYTAVYQPVNAASPENVPVSVLVMPRNGRLCTISPITDSYEASHIVITDGDQTLMKGRDYNVSTAVSGRTVTVTITFTGNYYGTVTQSFTFQEQNSWVVPLSIQNWLEGATPNAPVAAAKYGSPAFSYNVDGSWQNDPPTAAGEYIVRAVVPASTYYAEISAEVVFRILKPMPQISNLTAVYGDLLAAVSLPDGYTWDDPSLPVGDAGVHSFGAVFTPVDSSQNGGPTQLTVTVQPKDGNLCTISPITNGYDSRNIVIRDGTSTLVQGRDYYVSASVEENVVTVTISFAGNYKGTAVRTFTFSSTNSWIVPLSLESWVWGDAPNTPVADAAYGEPEFSYLVDGTWQTEPPTEPGSYQVRAVVPATPYYAELSAQAEFRIYALLDVSLPEELTAVYGSLLRSVSLTDGFTWDNPDSLVGNVGTRIHAATYMAPGGTQESVGLHVEVTPRDGASCTISPITNAYEAAHVVIQDNSATLAEGTDYVVTESVSGNVVTVLIRFIGNYTGTVTRTYTFSFENVWTEPLSITGWAVGESPNAPRALARYGTAVFSFASAANPLEASRDVPVEAGDYIVYADVPATIYYNGLSASLAFSITEESGQAEPELAPAPQYDVEIETRTGIGKVLTGQALMISRSGHTAEQVLPMAEAVPDASGTAKVISGPDGAILEDSDVIGTGSVMRLLNSTDPAQVYDEAVIAVLGDVTGTGQMNIAQLVIMCHAIVGTRPLTGVYLLAGDFNGNGKVDIADLTKAALILQSENI